MESFVINGDVWRVVRVEPFDPSLIDRTHIYRLATTSPKSHTIYLSNKLEYPMLDKVLLHEVVHAITVSYSLLPSLREKKSWNDVEEWNAQILENFSLEAVIITSGILGRPLCIRDYCLGEYYESGNS